MKHKKHILKLLIVLVLLPSLGCSPTAILLTACLKLPKNTTIYYHTCSKHLSRPVTRKNSYQQVEEKYVEKKEII
jgi:hypothetical protein